MNVERMNALIDLIEANPNDPVNFGAEFCVGGWMYRLANGGEHGYQYAMFTAEQLGVPYAQATKAHLGWPERLKEVINPDTKAATFPDARVEVLAMLRRWRDTGVVSWGEEDAHA